MQRGRTRTVASAFLATAMFGTALLAADVREAAAEGLRYEAHSTYTVDPGAGVVHVLVDMTITNEEPSSTSGNIITSYYWSEMIVPVVASATNFVATRDGNGQGVTLEAGSTPRFSLATIDLSPNLYYRDVARVQFRYDLPSAPPRSDADTRVNPAYATFVAFPVADPGLTSVRILIPKAFDVEYFGADMDESVQGDMRLYESGAIAEPDDWGVFFTGRNDKGLAVRKADTAEHKIEIRAWPDDERWSKFVQKQVRGGLPELEELIGLPWSNNRKLQITETVSPYLYGYAGWYQSENNTIEIGDALDGEVVLHEVSHIWFNDELFTDRWINEGFAQTYSNLALDTIGGKAKRPDRVKQAAKGAQPLNQWGDPSFRDDEIARLEEEFGYNAAWFVVRALTNEIGTDKMREVFLAASEGTYSYLGDPEPETVSANANWKRLLDLVENVGGSTKATALFRDYVVIDSQRRDLQARTRARKAYDKLVASGDGWTVPASIREDMTLWRFRDVTTDIAVARKILSVRNDIESELDGTGIGLPESFETDYEGDGDLAELLDEAKHYKEVAEQLADATDAADSGHGLFGSIGLWRNDYREDLDAAGNAFEDGKVDRAERGAVAVLATVDDAGGVGQRRVLTVAGIIVGLILLIWLFRRWRRARRRKRAARAAAAAEARAAALADELALVVTAPYVFRDEPGGEASFGSEAGGEPLL